MTPAELALENAMHFEGQKCAYRQTKEGVVVSFVVHPNDVPKGLATAPLYTRYVVAVVQLGDDEKPVQSEREVVPNPPAQSKLDAQPQPVTDKPLAGAKQKRAWEDLLPQKQAAIRLHEPAFAIFLREAYPKEWRETSDANECLKLICGVASKKELETVHASRMLWKGVDESFKLWERL